MIKNVLPTPVKRGYYFIYCKHLAFFIFLAWYSSVFDSKSQHRYTPVSEDPLKEPWRWKRYRELDGKGINSMIQTKDGMYWFATCKGLYQYNGVEWSNPVVANLGKTGFIRNFCLSYDSLAFYMGTDSGLFYVDRNKFVPILTSNGNKSIARLFRVNKIILLHDSSILVSMGFNQLNSLLKVKGNRQVLFAAPRTIHFLKGKLPGVEFKYIDKRLRSDESMSVESIFQDNSQNIWLSIVNKNNKNKIVSFGFDQTFRDSMVHINVREETPTFRIGKHNEFGQTADDKIWIINHDSEIGIYEVSGNQCKNIYPCIFNSSDNLLSSFLHGKDGTLWIGSFGVLYAFRNNQWITYRAPIVEVPNSPITVYEDRKGYLWIYGEKKEIYQIDYSNQTWTTYKGLNYQAQSADGKTWFISADNQVVVKDKNQWIAYNTADGLPDAMVKLTILSNGTPWVAGSHQGIACAAYWSGGRWTKRLFPALSWGIDARAVYEDSKKQLWLGCSVNNDEKKGQLAGVVKLQNPGTANQITTHYYRKHGIANSNSYGIGETKSGQIMMCGSCLLSLSGDQWTRVTHPFENTQYQEIISTVKGGDMWVGSRYYGILKTDGVHWKNYTIENGLASNTVISILPLNEKDIWVATDNDICRFDGDGWTSNIFPAQMTLIREGGELLKGDGKLWINHSPREWKRRARNHNKIAAGVAAQFQTMGYKADTFPPNTRIKLFDKQVSYYGNTIISWAGSDLSPSTANNRISFSYRINNGAWSAFKEKTYESFTGLPSGHYQFEVRARDLDFNIDPSPASIEFWVLAPVWKQSWFITLIGLFMIIIIVYEIRARKRQRNMVRLNKVLHEAKDKLETKQHEIIAQNLLLEQQKKQIIEQKNSEKEAHKLRLRFFTNISHEFRTPLTIINGIISKLNESPAWKSNPEDNHHLATLQRNANQLLKLISQLMDFRKLETGALKLKVSQGDIGWHAKEICDTYHNLALESHIRLEYSSPEKLDVFFDADFIEKILNNLLSNAIKFTPKGGLVRVSVHDADTTDGDWFFITVEDTGIGIPEEEMKKIFEPFYQVNRKNRNETPGTGIGLSLVNHLVKAHHGELDVTSLPTAGKDALAFTTCFRLKLPKHKEAYSKHEIAEDCIPSSPETIMATPAATSKITDVENIARHLVLVVEDNTDLRNLITATLKNHFTCCEADNGISAFDMAVEQVPDLIVSDIMMPLMNGMELCGLLKRDARTKHIPIILLTARTADEHQQEGYLSGADAYVTKPFNMSLLVTRIHNLIESRSLLRKQFSSEFRLQSSELIITSEDADFLKMVIGIIEKNITDPAFSVETLSREVNMGSRSLLRKIISLTECKPVELIRIIRLKRAEQILLQNQYTIAQIAYDVGFTDPGYFSKCFASYFGMPPKEYLEKKLIET
jgi:signal transduction histidine kinase/AraC-like DNA-binding protein/ligand-binding sensor domain-containing protein